MPSRGQSIAELGLDFVRIQIVEEILGEKLGRKYLPLLAAMFFGIFAMNITGIVPGLNIAGTSVVGDAAAARRRRLRDVHLRGLPRGGGATFFKNALFPAGVPWSMYILLTPIEFINIFIVRPISLALRLLLNMMVGHLLLVLCFAATHFFFFCMTGGIRRVRCLTLIGGFVMTLVEMRSPCCRPTSSHCSPPSTSNRLRRTNTKSTTTTVGRRSSPNRKETHSGHHHDPR